MLSGQCHIHLDIRLYSGVLSEHMDMQLASQDETSIAPLLLMSILDFIRGLAVYRPILANLDFNYLLTAYIFMFLFS